MTEPAPAVHTRGLEVVYERGGQPAVADLDLDVVRGSGLLVSGGEGAGKTTLLRAILGLVVANGEVGVLGGVPGDPELRRRIGYGPQGKTFAEGHSARALVRIVVAIRRGAPAPGLAEEAMDRAGLSDATRGRTPIDVEDLRRVSLACAIAGDPELLVLDDPWEFPETVAEIAQARARGGTVIAASHDPGGLPELLGRTLHLVDGRAT